MKKLLIGLSILMAVNFCVAASKPKVEKITPEKILQEINTSGSQQTVTRLNATPGAKDWTEVRKKIELGNADWLTVAEALSKGVNDFKTWQELRVSLSLALPKNAAGVLHLINLDPINISYLCSAPFTDRGSSFLSTYFSNTIKALNEVKEPGLQEYVQQCTVKLKQTVAVERALRQKQPSTDKGQGPIPDRTPEPSADPDAKPATKAEPAPPSDKK